MFLITCKMLRNTWKLRFCITIDEEMAVRLRLHRFGVDGCCNTHNLDLILSLPGLLYADAFGNATETTRAPNYHESIKVTITTCKTRDQSKAPMLDFVPP